jgi:hypothetical protein
VTHDLEKPFTKIGLVEWLKVKSQSSSSNTAKQNKTKNYSRARDVAQC